MTIGKKLFIRLNESLSEKKESDWERFIENKVESHLERNAGQNDRQKRLAIDLLENANNYVILIPIPGIPETNINIFLDTDVLTISGQSPKECSELGKPVYQECEWGEFSRSITLPKNIKKNGHQAKIKNGLLTITLPKLKITEPKKINIISYD